MNVDTGEIHHFDEEELKQMHFQQINDRSERMVDMERKMVSLSDDEAAELENQPVKKRKGWMRNQPCVCGSGKKFKKCCWSQFK